MTQKAANIASLLSSDRSGSLTLLHAHLIGIGLKTKMPSNSATLLFEAIDLSKARHGLVAFRSGSFPVFSFPSTYWQPRASEVAAAISAIDRGLLVVPDGAISSSQYSMCQVRVTDHTINQLVAIADTLISRHVRRLSGEA